MKDSSASLCERRSRVVLTVFFAVFLLQLGCSRTRTRFEDLLLPQAPELFARINANQAALKDFTGAGILQVSGGQTGKIALGIKLKYLSPRRLWLSLNGPMGIGLGTLLLAGDRYELAYASPAMHASGWIADFDFPEETGLKLQGDDVWDFLLPLASLSALPDSACVKKDLAAQQYLLSWSDSAELHRLWADPYRPVIVRELCLSPDGDTLASKETGDVKKHAGVHFPMSWNVRIGKGNQGYSMKLKLARLEVNAGLTAKDFTIEPESRPDTAEVKVGG